MNGIARPGGSPRAFFQFKAGDELILSLNPGSDLVKSITEIARDTGIEAGSLVAIGALKQAKLGYYDQNKNRYREIKVDSPTEIASCAGNISIRSGEPFAHIHVVLADSDGKTKAGHLLEGIVFVAEVHLRTLQGPKLERKYDATSGLWLWSEG
ncbi:MAG: PPC domain-containing DNA-binding protein [Dehalococcoidia bacterium]